MGLHTLLVLALISTATAAPWRCYRTIDGSTVCFGEAGEPTINPPSISLSRPAPPCSGPATVFTPSPCQPPCPPPYPRPYPSTCNPGDDPNPCNPCPSNPYPSNPYPSNPCPSNPCPSNPYPSNPCPSNAYPSNPCPSNPCNPCEPCLY